MSIILKKALPRRTFLRGVGATLAIPLLDAMIPALTVSAGAAASSVRRLAFTYVPNGVAMNDKVNLWKPAAIGSDFEFSPILSPMQPFRDRVVVVSGLSHRQGEAFNDGGGDHSRASAGWLSGTHAVRSSGAEVRAATTVDQLAAAVMGQDTRLPSLELSTDPDDIVGNCDNGYSCVYINTFSWRTPTTPLPTENNPQVVFERLFGNGGNAEQRAVQSHRDKSILDWVMDDVSRLQRRLGAGDRARVDEYLVAVREVERRIERAAAAADVDVPIDRPVGIPESFDEHVKLMYDLQWLAFHSDLTRVTSFLIGRELAGRSYPELGVPENHHAISHHQDNPGRIASLSKINRYHVELFARFVERLKTTPEGDGCLLDNTVMLYGSGMSDPNAHKHIDLPLMVVGGPSGKGQHLSYPVDTPMANLLVALLDKVGIPVDWLGDSTGPLAEPLEGV